MPIPLTLQEAWGVYRHLDQVCDEVLTEIEYQQTADLQVVAAFQGKVMPREITMTLLERTDSRIYNRVFLLRYRSLLNKQAMELAQLVPR